jgi:hypothetical protein
VPVEAKKGKGKLTREELLINKAVEEEKVPLRTVVLGDEEAGVAGKKVTG